MIINPTEALPYLQAKKLKAIAVAHDQRLPLFPDVPTTRESGLPGVEASVWWGMLAPAKTPTAIIEKLQREAAAALAQPDVRERLLGLGITPVGNTPEEFAAQWRADLTKFEAVVKAAAIKAE